MVAWSNSTTKLKVIIQTNIWYHWYYILATLSVMFACHPIWRGHPQSRDPWRHVKTHYISLCARLLTYQKQDFHWHLESVRGATPARLPRPQISLQNKAQYICVSYQLSVIAYARKKTSLKTLCPVHLQMYYSCLKLKFMIRYRVLHLYHQDSKDLHRIKITMMEE